MKKVDYILMADQQDETAVDYTLDKAGATRFWIPTPFGVRLCNAEMTVWMLIKFIVLLGAAWMTGHRINVKWRKVPGE